MPSQLDQQYEAVLAALTGPGGRLVIERDELGRAYVGNFPGTLPLFFKTFAMLNGPTEMIVDGAIRLTFAEADALSDRIARGLVALAARRSLVSAARAFTCGVGTVIRALPNLQDYKGTKATSPRARRARARPSPEPCAPPARPGLRPARR